MNALLQKVLSLADDSKRALRAVKGPQVHSQSLRNDLRLFAGTYFKDVRPSVLRDGIQAQDLQEVDAHLQELAELCHKHGAVTKYLRLVGRSRKALIALDGRILSTSTAIPSGRIAAVDQEIVRTLTELIPGAAASYQQALVDLQGETRSSWRGPATDLRESLRETLDHLAPDADVIAMPGFKAEPNTNGPTMKQKVRFVLKSREVSKSVADPAEDAANVVETIVGSFVRSVYTRSSVSTHTPTDKKEVTRLLQYVRLVLCELLEVEAT